MSGVEHGIARAFSEIVVGGITSYALHSILVGFVNSGLLSSSWLALFDLLGVVGVFSLLRVMEVWKTPYLIGWIIAVLLLLNSGLLGPLEILVYVFVPILILLERI